MRFVLAILGALEISVGVDVVVTAHSGAASIIGALFIVIGIWALSLGVVG